MPKKFLTYAVMPIDTINTPPVSYNKSIPKAKKNEDIINSVVLLNGNKIKYNKKTKGSKYPKRLTFLSRKVNNKINIITNVIFKKNKLFLIFN